MKNLDRRSFFPWVKKSIQLLFFINTGFILAYAGWKAFEHMGYEQFPMAGGTSGSVFRDYNGDGTKQSGEPLVPGVTVNAYDASGALCATTVSIASNSAPNYTLPMGCSGQIRIEFVIGSLDDCLDPGIDFTALNGAAYGSSVQFVDASAMSPVNFALYNPADYNRGPANTKVFIPCYTTGDPLVSGTSRAGAWFLGFPYNNTGTVAKSNVLTGETIGSTWGVAYSEQAKVIFTSAFLKRHVGLGVMGSGGIYKLVPTPTSFTATSFYDMDANGHRTRAIAGCLAYGNGSSFTINAAPGTEVTYNGAVDPLTGLPCGLGVIGTNALRGLVGDKASKSHDPAAFDQVGKVSLGDLEISDDGLHLFVTNLYNRYVYRLTLNDASNPTSVVAVDSFALPAPTPSVTNGVLRPFATKYQRGKLYIGALSTGENGGVNTVGGATDMNAYVFELANANTAPSLTAMSQALTYPLNYLKGPSRRDMTGVNRGEKWNPWTRNNGVSLGTSDYRTYPTPMLTDLEFTERGDLVMAFTDRSGHQWGWFNDRNFTGTVLINYIVGGDILMAGVNCNTGAYTLENNGSFTSSGIGFTTNTVVAAPNVNGVGNMDGPGGGEFFDQELYNPYHDETDQGALAVLPGDNKVINTIMDPLGIFEGGTVKFSTINGDESHRYRLFENATGNFGKANGLGDLELDGLIPPLEIGNRVWFDTDMDGVQDPGEAPIANVTVELYDGITLIGTDVTDVNGNYYFDTLNVADGNQSLDGNQKGPQPNRTYTIRIGDPDWTAGAGTGDLTGYVLTSSNVGGAGQPDVRDNDGVLASMIPTISYTTGGPGQNDHTLDFGFILADEPIVDLALRKTIDTILQDGTNPTALNNGDTIKFKIQLFNQGELGMDSLNVTDYLPAGLKFVNATGTGQVNEGWDGTDPSNPVYKWRSNTGSGGGGSLTTAQTLPLTAQTGDGVSSLSFMHNPGTGSNRLLVLGIAVGNDGVTGEPPTVTSAQFQSGNLDFVGTVQSPGAGGSNDNDVRIYIYKQNNPTGSGNIDISLSGSGDISAQAVTFNGVDLSNPLGAFQNTSGLTSPVSNMFSASSGQVVFSMLGVDGGTSITSTGGQTVIFNGSNDQVSGAAVYENGPNPTTTFTLGGDQDWALGAVPINVYSQPPFNPGDTIEICIYTTLEHVPGNPTAADFTNFAEISFARDTNGVDQSANDIDSPLNNNPNDNAGGQQGSPADDYINGDGSGTPGDGVAPTDQDNHDPAFLNIFDLALKKTIDTGSISGNGLYSVGTDITFNITVTNQGTDTATNIEITDYLPCGLSFSLAPPNPGWTRTGLLATYTAPGPLAPGQSLIVPIILQISPSDSCNPDPLDYINVAEISGAEDDEGNTYTSDVDSDYDQIKNNDAGGNVNSPSDDVITGDGTGTPNDEVADTDEDDQDPAELLVFDLALRKIVSPATPGYPGPYNVNDTIRFDITIFNQGNIDADTVQIVDNLPAGLSFSAGDNIGLNWVAGPGANQVQRTLNMVGGDTLNAGEDTTVSIFLRVLHTSGGISAYTNISEITSATAIIDGLNVTMSGDADSPYDANPNNDAGGQVTSPADNEILGNGTGSPGDGIASSDEDDQDPALVTIVDVALKKLISASTPGPYQYGDTVQFEITVTNQGTIALDSVEVTDYIPSGFTFGANPDWTLSGSDAIRVIRSRLDPSEDTLITINLVIAAESDLSKVDSAWINYAEVSQAFDTLGTNVSLLDIDSDLDNNPGNNAGGRPLSDADNYIDGDGTGVIGDGVDTTDQDNHDPALVSVVDVALRKIAADTLGDASLAFGDTIRFDIQIFNQGNVVIDSLTITDYIPEGFAYLPLFNPDWSGSYPSPQYGWGSSDDLLPGESDTISIYLQIASVGEPNLAKYTNYAEISFASDTLGVNQSSNDSDSPLNTLDDDNAGGQPLSLADDYIDGNGSGAIGDGVASTDQDNHDPASVYPRVVDVALVKRIGFTTPGPFTLGDTVVFDLKIVNQGTITLDSVYLVDYIPAGFAFDAVLNPAWTLLGNQASTIVDETLLPGQSTIVSISLIILKITDLSLVDSAWTNRAEITRIFDEDGNDVSSEDADSPLDNDPDNNPGGQPGSPADDEENGDGTGSPGDGVPGTDQDNADPAFVDLPDLALRKIIQDTLGDGFLNYGDTIKFGILLFNQGNIPVDSIRIEDSIPSGYSFVPGSLNAGWILAGQDATYDWGQGDTLFPGEIDTVCIYLTLNMVTPSAAGHWINRAEITYFADTLGNPLDDIDSEPDDEQTNDPGGSPDTPSDDAIDGDGTGMPGDTSSTTDEDDEDPAGLKFYDLALVKEVAAGSTVTAYGDSVKFLLTITNQGTEPVDSIIITDTLPAGLMFDNSLPVNIIWTPVGNELTTMLRTRLDPGEDTVICLALKVLKNYDLSVAGSTWVNQAEISSAFDTLGMDIDDRDIDSPLDENYGNNGGGRPESPADDETGGNGTGPVGGPDSGTDQDNADPALVEVADLALRKVAMDTLGDNVLLFGDTVKIAIQIFNQGSIPVDSIVITDSLPAGLGFVTGPLNAGWVFNGSDYEYGWGTGDTLSPGESDTVCIYVIFQLGFPGTPETYTNLAEISEFFDTDGNPLDDVDSAPDDNQANDGGGEPKTGSDDPIDGDGTGMPGDTSSVTDEDDEDPLELGFFDLALRKVISPGSAATAYGDTVKFDLTIFNQGSIPTDSILITDSLPAGFSFDPTIPGNAGWVQSGNKLTKAVYGTLLTGLEDTTICLWLTVEQVINPAERANAWINYAEISEAWLAGNDISSLDIDSELNNLYGDNAGGLPESPADNEVDGDGTGAIGDGVDTTDQDNADPALVEIVDLALRKVIMDTLGDATLEYGDTVKFAIHLFNQGNVPIDSLNVNDTLPAGFSFINDPGLNAGWVLAGNEANYGWGTGETLFPGESDTICIYLRLDMVISGIPDYTNRAEISYAEDTAGVDRSNDDIDSPLNDNYGDNAGGQPESPADNEVDGDGTGAIGDGVDTTDQDNADPALVEIVDLALRKVIMDTLGDATLEYGDTVKFAIQLFNQGNVTIDSLNVNDTLPAGFSFINDPGLNAGWVLAGNEANYGWGTGETLFPGESDTICIYLRLDMVISGIPDYTNRAEISYAEDTAGVDRSNDDIDSPLNDDYGDNAGGLPESPADNEVDGDGTGAIGDGIAMTDQDNADPAYVEIVDLALRKIIMDTLGDATLEYGDTVKFAIHLFNQGNVPIDSLVVNDTLPNGFSFVNDPALNAGWMFAGSEANYGWGSLDTLYPGESDTICIYLRLEMVTSGIPDFTNRAEISYAQDTTGADRSNDDIDSPLNENYGDNAGGQPESPADNEVGGDGTGVIGDGVAPTDQDNADPAFVEIVDLALLKIIMDTLGDATLEYGDTIKFAIHLFNQGNVAIDSLMVNDTLPSGFSFVNDPGLNAGWTNPLGNETSYFWGESDTLNPGESDTICIYLRLEQVNTGVPDFTNRAEISYAEDLTGADRSNDDIDSPLNDQYWDNAGGQPESPADNEVDGDGTGALGDGVAPTDQDNADPVLVQVVDLALRKVILDTLGDATLEYGDTIKFAIHLFNQGNVPVEELTVTDTIPNGFSFVDNSLNTGWSLPAGNETQFVWGAGDTLNPGESDTLCIYLRLEMILSGIPDFVNRAEISSATGFGETDLSDSDIDSPLNGNYGDNAGGQPDSPADDEVEGLGTGAIGDGVDSTDQDNADPARVEVLDLALRKLLIPGPRMTVVYADTAEFVIEVINQGNVPATNIKITDSLPDGFVADAGVNPGWTMVNSTSAYSTYCYTLTDTLQPGDTASLNFYGIVESSEMQGAWINYAEITSVQDTTGADRSGDDIDSSPDGNVGGNDGGGQPESEADDETNGDGTGAIGDGVASTDEDDEDPAALMLFNLALKKEIDGSTPGPYRYGDTVRFVVTVVNQGNIPATNIEVSDSIPAGFAFDAGLNPDWTGPGPVVTLVFTDTIAMGDTVTALLDLIVQPVVDPMLRQNAWTNLAEISYAEDTSGNNTDTNLPDHDSYPDDNFTNDAGGRPESPADNYLNGNGQGQPGDGVAETDEDDADPALVEVFDLALVKQIDSAGTPLPYTYGDLIKYKLRVINQGNEPAVNIEVADYIPQGLVFDGPSNPEWSLIDDSTAVTTIADTLFADEDTVLCIYLRLQPAADRNAWVNVAEISYAEDSTGTDRSNDDADHVLDRDRTNNAGSQVNSPADDYVDGDGTGSAGDGIAGTDGDNIDPAWLDVFDLALIKTTPHLVVQEGEVVDFYITVYNQGNIDAENIKVTDYIPLDMSLAASPGWTVLPPDSACYTIPGPLFVGDSITIQINLQVDDPAVNLPEGLYNYAEISSATDTMDADYPDIDGDFDADPGNDPGGDLFNDDDNNISGNGKRGEDEDNHDGAYVIVCKGYVCNDRVNVSFGDLCEIIVTGDDVIENPMLPSIHYRVTLRDASGKTVPDARLTRAHMGYCFTYSVDAPACPANSCWGTICVEDKAPPMIDCSPDTVLCFELSNLPSEGTVNDNCSGPVKVNVVSEQYIDYGCDSAFIQGVVKRRLIATDTWKNTMDCEKIYYVRRLNIEDLVCPRDTAIDCSLEVVNKVPFSHPSRSGAPTIEGIALWPNNVSCKVLTDYKDEISEVCGDGYKIYRTWTIVDWCGRRDTMCTQTIKVIDQTPPLAYDRTLPTMKADPHDCRAQIQLDTLAVSDCSKVIQTYSYPYLDEATGVIKIATGTLPARVWVTSGVTVIDVTLTDGCFNRSQNTITVKVVDETPPTPVCKEYTQVTVDPVSCWTVVKAKDLDNGSHDNCIKPLHFAVARMADIEKARADYLNKIEAECGLKEYKEHKAWYDRYIEDWINMYVFDDELHMDDCGENQVVLRVYEADSMPRLDPHVWKCGAHEWFCYNTYPSYRLVHNYHFFSTNPPASKDCDAGAPWLCKKASEQWFADRKNQFEFSRYYGTNDGANFPQTRLYNDCMVKVIVDDKQPPVVDHLEDITVYCDHAPAGKAYARQLCKQGEEFEHWPGPLSHQGETYGYYGGSDHIRRGHTDHQDPVYGCDHGDQWAPVYCRKWLYLDSFDQSGPVDPTQYFSTLVKFDKDRPARPLGSTEFSVTDNCRLDDTTMHITDIGSVNGCGEGWYQRTWTIKDKCGNVATAIQKVIVKHRSDFEVVFPADLEVTCDTENATDSSRTGKPVITDDECEVIGVRYVDEISTIDQGDGACYKIIRTWTLIDWCIYDPNAHTIHPDVIVDDRLRANDTDRVCVFRNLKDNGDGFMKYVQIIKVFDHEAPVLNCRDTTICLTEGCLQGVNIPLEGADNCSEEVLYRLDITRPDGSVETRVNINSISGNFTAGVYTIRIIGKDHCENADTCTMRLTMRDCKAPTPYCLNGIATVVMPLTGAIEIWAKDLDRGSTDNCTPNSALKFSFSSNVGEASRVFRCSDIPDGKQQAIPVDIWVTDQAGNQDYCRTYILLQDNGGQAGGVCKDTTLTTANINGKLYTEDKEGVEFATVELKGVGQAAIPSFKTGSDGNFAFSNIQLTGPVSIKALRDDNPMNGLSTLDLVILQKHLLGTEKLKSPYKVIAADINNSQDISVVDLVELRKLILGLYDQIPGNTSWKFIPKSHSFTDVQNPWGFPTEELLDKMNEQEVRDFIGVKIGDLNSSAIPHSLIGTEVRGFERGLTFETEDRLVRKGEEVLVTFRSPNFRGISGWQGTLHTGNLQFVGVGNDGKLDLKENNFGQRWAAQGMLTMSWNHHTGMDLDDQSPLFTLIFKAGSNGRLSEMLRIGSQHTVAESYEGKGELGGLSIRFVTPEGSTVTSQSVLYQNYPNPFDQRTVIGINLAQEGRGILRIMDITGRTLKTIERDWSKGYQEVWLDRREIGATGLLYYRFESRFFTASRKMLIVD